MTQVVDRPSQPQRSPAVDPRLRARRIEVRRAEGRRRLRRLIALAVVTLVCAAAWGASRSPLLDLDHIEVEGASRLSVEAVVGASGLEIGTPLADLDLSGARDQVSSLPWIERASIDRSWWGRVSISVVERRPVAIAQSGGGTGMLVDAQGWILDEAAPADLATLPSVAGIDVPTAGAQLTGVDRVAIQVAARASLGLREWVDHISVDDEGLWLELRSDAVTAAGGTPGHPGRVQLGDGRELSDQLVAAETVLARVELSCLAVIDVRVPSSPVVRRSEECAPVGEPA